VRRTEDALEVRGVRRIALLQGGEDAAAVVVDHHDPQVRPSLVRADDEPVRVVQEGEITDQRVRRSRVRERGADRGRDRAVDTGQTAVGDGPDRYDRREVEIADRVGGGDHEHAVGTGGRADGRGDRRPGEAVGEKFVDRRAGCVIRLLPAFQPVGYIRSGDLEAGDDGGRTAPRVRPQPGRRDHDHLDVGARQQLGDRPRQRRVPEHQHPLDLPGQFTCL